MEKNWFTFHRTEQGTRHILEGMPCQDSSVSFSDTEKDYQIIVVADGHGDTACTRSATGAAFATEIAKECLKNFAEAIIQGDMKFDEEDRRHQMECVQQLKETIVVQWYNSVHKDMKENEMTEKEYDCSGVFEEAYRRGDCLEHLYGTTLIAALRVTHYFILLQQGDGRCVVCYEDGSMEESIPWDERCVGNVTTSMCDADAIERIRTAIIDLNQSPVTACYIGSDGVEALNDDDDGTYRFIMEVSCKLVTYGQDKFPSFLEKYLPEYSRNESQDDISVAGIVDIQGLEAHCSSFEQKVKSYDKEMSLRKNIAEKTQKIISMERKRKSLKIQSESLKAKVDALDKEFNDVKTRFDLTWITCTKELKSLKQKKDEIFTEYKNVDDKYKEYETLYVNLSDSVEESKAELQKIHSKGESVHEVQEMQQKMG